jgi:hypothetical protein
MKISEMSHAEKIALTESHLERMIDIALAEEGIPFASSPGNAPERSPPERDVTVFAIADHLFKTREAAEIVASALRQAATEFISFDYGTSYDRSIVRPATEDEKEKASSVSVKKLFSREKYNENRQAIARDKEEKESWEKRNKEYESFQRARNEIAKDIRKEFNSAWEIQHRVEYLHKELIRYRDLADGNREIANRFFEKAHSASLTDEIRTLIAELDKAGLKGEGDG